MKFNKILAALIGALCVSTLAFAGVIIEDVNKKHLGVVGKLGCGTGITCTVTGEKATLNITGGAGSFTTVTASGTTSPQGGVVPNGYTSTPFTTFATWQTPTLTSGTSTTPSATTVYLAQVVIPFNVTLTGIAVNNAGTCGTNSYVVALFNAAGTPLANSATAGTLCSGTSAWQKIAFTGTVAVVGPGIYYVGLYMNGTTDRFYTIPAIGAYAGLAGVQTGQTFGTVASITPLTTFTAGDGPVAYTY